MPLSSETTQLLARANDVLRNSPYSFPDDEASRQRAVEIRKSTEVLAETLPKLHHFVASRTAHLRQELGRIHRSQEIYESNAIEGVGLSLEKTHELLGGLFERKRDPTTYAEWALLEGIRADNHTYEVIGLDAARSLARSLARDMSRPVSEVDIRALHKLILGDRPDSGRYKRYHVTIAGSEHEPPFPIDTPTHVSDLVAWLNRRRHQTGDATTVVVEAAALHAWFAHIHPFEDGNGRVARLLANLVVCRNGLPPLIVRNRSDRGRYIDALAASDSGGDITRLVLSFGRYLERAASDFTDPVMARRVFEADVLDRTQSTLFKYWETQFTEWLNGVRRELTLLGFHTSLVGGLSSGDFEYLRHRNHRGNSWLMKVQDRSGQDLLVWLGYPNDHLYRNLDSEEVLPTLYVSVRNSSGVGSVPYVWIRNDPRQLFTDFVLEPRARLVYARGHARPFTSFGPEAAIDELVRTIKEFLREPPELGREYLRGIPIDPDLAADDIA